MKRFLLFATLVLTLACDGGGGVFPTGPVAAEYACAARVFLPSVRGAGEAHALSFTVTIYESGIVMSTIGNGPSSIACPPSTSGDCQSGDWAFHLNTSGDDAQFATATYLGDGRARGEVRVIPCALTTPYSESAGP